MEKEQVLQDFEELQTQQEPIPANGTEELSEDDFLDTLDAKELRTAINNCSDTIEVLLPIPEWRVNGKIVRVLVRSMDVEERADFIQAMQKVNFDLKKLYPDLAIISTYHPKTKQRLWSNADRGMLQGKIGRAVERIAMVASDISGLDEKFLNSLKKN